MIILTLFLQITIPFVALAGTNTTPNNLASERIVGSYWNPGGDDCRTYHGSTKLDCAYIAAPGIRIDGVGNESVWGQGTNNNVRVPTACMNGSLYFFKSYINFTVIRDDTYIYFLLRWNDSTPTGLGSRQDEVDLCWNINMKDFTAYFALGMQTLQSGERVDSFGWNKLDYENGSVHAGKDQCFGSDGWYDRSVETQDISTGYTLLNISNVFYYQVEFRRKLVTNDQYDVQFDHNGEYEVNFAVINDLGHQDHAVSWNYAVNITGLPEQPVNGMVPWILCVATLTSGMALVAKKRNLIKRER